MTNRQACEVLSNLAHVLSIQDKLEWSKETKRYNEEIIDALKLGQKALYRMIPSEPDWEGDGYDSEGQMIYEPHCPECGFNLEEECYYNICPKCGQFIDWSKDGD